MLLVLAFAFKYDLILIAKEICDTMADGVKINLLSLTVATPSALMEAKLQLAQVINQHHFMKGVEIALQINAVSWQQILL